MLLSFVVQALFYQEVYLSISNVICRQLDLYSLFRCFT